MTKNCPPPPSDPLDVQLDGPRVWIVERTEGLEKKRGVWTATGIHHQVVQCLQPNYDNGVDILPLIQRSQLEPTASPEPQPKTFKLDQNNTLSSIEQVSEGEIHANTSMIFDEGFSKTHLATPNLILPAAHLAEQLIGKPIKIAKIPFFRMKTWPNRQYDLFATIVSNPQVRQYTPGGYQNKRSDLEIMITTDDGCCVAITGYQNEEVVTQVGITRSDRARIAGDMIHILGNTTAHNNQFSRSLPGIPSMYITDWRQQSAALFVNSVLKIITNTMIPLQHVIPARFGLYDHFALNAGYSQVKLPKPEDLLDGCTIDIIPPTSRNQIKITTRGQGIIPIKFVIKNKAGHIVGEGYFNQANPLTPDHNTVHQG